ncbi:MAG: zinc transporter ZupT [Clostridiales bacterium]|jgi:ZIP family zinc transporter|nr:zinc transporter ZupT [Clostridiales bacterium]
MFSKKILFAFLLTLIAGLSTGIGSVIALSAKKTDTKFLSVSLGFSAGVMIYVSMTEILWNAKVSLTSVLGNKSGLIAAAAAFFGGMIIIASIDKLIPLNCEPDGINESDAVNRKKTQKSDIFNTASGEKYRKFDISRAGRLKKARKSNIFGIENGGKTREAGISGIEKELVPRKKNKRRKKTLRASDVLRPKLLRSGLVTALALAVHNFPEGLATFMSALGGINVALPIVAAIAIHNIPEGIAVSVPVYYATGDKKKAFGYSFLSGATEPLGAAVGYFLLLPFLNDAVMGAVLAAVAGIMVFISIDGLLPSAREYGERYLSAFGFVGGMAVMAFGMVLFAA